MALLAPTAAPADSAGGASSEQPATARRAPQPAPVLRPSTTTPGTKVKVTGRLGTHVVRKVVLQRKVGKTWRRVARAKSFPTGRYRFTYPAPSATTRLRVKAPAFDKRGRHYRLLVTRPARLRVQLPPPPVPTAELSVPGSALGGGPSPSAVVTTTQVPQGTTITLQRRTGDTWHAVETELVTASGSTKVTLPLGRLGTGRAVVRAVVPGVGATAAHSLDVLAPGVIVTPEDDDEVDGPFEVVVDVAGSLTATRVQLYVDGFVMPDAEPLTGQPGRWSAMLDPASAGVDRRHVDVVARVTTAAGSALTEPVRIDLLPSVGGVPAGFRVDTVASGFELPTSLAPIDAHRVLVAEKGGLVRLAVDGVVSPTPVLDLRDEVADVFDAGVLDVTLDPDFGDNGWFYVAYVVDDGGADAYRSQRVVRFTLASSVADPASAHVVLGAVPLASCKADPTTAGCLLNHSGMHTVDDLLFAPDGSLFVSVGDGAAGEPDRALVAQDLDVLAGKVLQVDPETGLGVPGNPYYEAGSPGSNRSRVYAYGFRNPFRMALSPDGDLYVGDVGEVAWEEVDRIVPGGNYGWPCFEGEDSGTAPPDVAECDDVRDGTEVEHRTPLVAYRHVSFAGSITLGDFATGGSYPAAYDGRLFLGDYTMGKVWTLDPDPDSGGPRLDDFGTPPGLGAGVDYEAGPDGDIWYADIASGSIRRVVYDPGQASCPSGQFLMETFRGRGFEPEPDGEPLVSSCVGRPPPGPDLVAPGDPNQGDGWSMRWSGTPQLAPGTYRLTAKSSGTLTVTVDGGVEPDGGNFTVAGADVGAATADVLVTLKNNPDFDDEPFFVNFDWGYRLDWERIGSAPIVSLHDVGQGITVVPGSQVGWSVSATGSDGQPIAPADLRVTVTLLHYGTGKPHRHPSGTYVGTSGSAELDDDHATGKIAYRLVGVATDPTGWVAESDPVYVSLVGSMVGPCA